MDLFHGEIKDLPEIDKLLSAHHKEIEWVGMYFNPDWKTYHDLIEKKVYRFFVARLDDELIGYAGFFVVNHLHYQVLS